MISLVAFRIISMYLTRNDMMKASFVGMDWI